MYGFLYTDPSPLQRKPVWMPAASIFSNICSGVTPPRMSGELFANHLRMFGSTSPRASADGIFTYMSIYSPGEISATAYLQGVSLSKTAELCKDLSQLKHPLLSTVYCPLPTASVAARTTVDGVDGPADVTRLVRSKERGEGRDLLRRTDRLHHAGSRRHDPFTQLPLRDLEHRRLHGA